MQIDIKQVTKIKVEPGEVLVFELGQEYPRPVMNNINYMIEQTFPQNKAIVIPAGMVKDIKAIKIEEAPCLDSKK